MAIPKIVAGTFEFPSGKVVEVGSIAWLEWLEQPENRSFRFDDGITGFTARKEKVKGQDNYWYAYVSVLGKTRKKYLGKSNSLTQPRMLEVEQQLHNLGSLTQTLEVLPNASLGKTFSKLPSAKSFDIEGLKAEILAELRVELHRELGKTREPSGEIPQIEQLQKDLEEARSQLADKQREIEDLELKLENARAEQVCKEKPDYEPLAAAALASLKLGKQAPGYKSATKAIAKFRELLQSG
jgi:vacuolar-type H+-ATPase subunit I/STV1